MSRSGTRRARPAAASDATTRVITQGVDRTESPDSNPMPAATRLDPELLTLVDAWRDNQSVHDLVALLADLVLREQELFWIRFTAFAALHAGLLALFGSDSARVRLLLAIAGTVLASVWVMVQWISLYYANRYKRQERLVLGILRINLNGRPRLPASTHLGVATAVIFLLFWPLVLIDSLTSGNHHSVDEVVAPAGRSAQEPTAPISSSATPPPATSGSEGPQESQ